MALQAGQQRKVTLKTQKVVQKHSQARELLLSLVLAAFVGTCLIPSEFLKALQDTGRGEKPPAL